MKIIINGLVHNGIDNNLLCEFRHNKLFNFLLLCTLDQESAKYITAKDICDSVENHVSAIFDIKTPSTDDNQKETLCNKISATLKTYSKELKLMIEPKACRIKLQISLELLVFFDDIVALFHIGDTRTYSSKNNYFALITGDQNNLASWVERNVTTYMDGQREQDAMNLINGIGLNGALLIEPKLIPISKGEKLLIVSQNTRQALRSIKLKAIIHDIPAENVPQVALNEFKLSKFKGSFGVIVCEVRSYDNDADTKKAWGFLDRFSIVKKSLLFSELNEEESLRLLSICKTQQLSTGEYLIRQGSHSRDIYFVLDGELEIRTDEIRIGTLGTGQVLGEMGSFTGEPRSADAIAQRLTYIMVFEYVTFMTLLNKDLVMAYKVHSSVIRELSLRNKKLNREITKDTENQGRF